MQQCQCQVDYRGVKFHQWRQCQLIVGRPTPTTPQVKDTEPRAMMITTKGAARFHAGGFVPARQSSGDEVMGMATAPHPHSMHGTKRLASCREELERSWQGVAAPQHHHDDVRCVSMNSMSNDSDFSEDDFGSEGRAKRRRTLQSSVSNDDGMGMMEESCFVRGTRITPDNRPPRQPQPHTAKAPVQAGWYPPTHEAPSRPPVKAGWYEGEIDAHGHRHGRGTTKHDDGTEHTGHYAHDAMDGEGKYKFVPARTLVPHPRGGGHLQRHVEKSFVGTFQKDMPKGAGTIVTRTVDYGAPRAPGGPFDIPFTETVYDVGMHRAADGKAVGEGVRIVYSTKNADGRSTLEKTCFRLNNGENTNLQVADEYAAWILQCMGVEMPAVPSSAM